MKLIIFDCDGTIADSQHMICAAMDLAFNEQQLTPPSRADILGVIGLSLELAISRLLGDQILHPTQSGSTIIDHLAESYRRAFTRLRADPTQVEPLFDGALDAITRLSARDDIVLGLATGKSRRGVDRLLERENLAGHFATIQTADDHPSKPHPSMIATAMAQVGTAPNDTVMIGDTTFDIDMALAAGTGAIGVTWGYHPADALTSARPHALIETFDDLENAIDGVFTLISETIA